MTGTIALTDDEAIEVAMALDSKIRSIRANLAADPRPNNIGAGSLAEETRIAKLKAVIQKIDQAREPEPERILTNGEWLNSITGAQAGTECPKCLAWSTGWGREAEDYCGAFYLSGMAIAPERCAFWQAAQDPAVFDPETGWTKAARDARTRTRPGLTMRCTAGKVEK